MKFSRNFVQVAFVVVGFGVGAVVAANFPAAFDFVRFEKFDSFQRDAGFQNKKFGQVVPQRVVLPSGVEVAVVQPVVEVPTVVADRAQVSLPSVDVSRSVDVLGVVQVVNPVVVADVVADGIVVNGVVVDGVSVASVVVDVPVVGSVVSGNGSVVAGLEVDGSVLSEVSRDVGIA